MPDTETIDAEQAERAMSYAHDTGFDEGYECGYEDGYADGYAAASNGGGEDG